MARRRGRNSGNNTSTLFLIIIGILIYLLFPRLQNAEEQKDLANQNNVPLFEEDKINESNKEEHDMVAFVIGNTENSPAPELTDNKNVKDNNNFVLFAVY